ncbi:hypothetical protein PDM98_26315 [Bacillus cereus]|nr:hypothetical protein [Bacillus cereus]
MKLDFETWITTQNLPDDAVSLFNESILCYRVGAYRAAFLMSYLGFMKELKNRLTKSDKPSVLTEKRWKSIGQELLDENKWESTAFTTTQEAEGKVYLITADLKDDMRYWRRKRNECAHAKDSFINYSHVDTFWLFLQSNMAKFVVNGGKEGLLAKIDRYFDDLYTAPDTDFTDLIKNIPLVVKTQDIPILLKDIFDNHVNIDVYTNQEKSSVLFWKAIAYSVDVNLNKAFLDFILLDSEYEDFCTFVAQFPDKFSLFVEKAELMRVFYKRLLFRDITNFSRNFWELSIAILKHNLIHAADLEEFLAKLRRSITSYSYPNEKQSLYLREFGFFNSIKEEIFDSRILNNKYTGGYTYANSNNHKIILFLKNMPLDTIIVSELNELFKDYTFGSFYSDLNSYIQENPQFLIEFRRIAAESNITLTDFFSDRTEEPVSQVE